MAPATHASPPLAIPAWAGLRLEPGGGVELSTSVPWVLEVEALAGPVLVGPPALRVTGGRLLDGPQPASGKLIRAGEAARWSFRVRLEQPGPRARLEAVIEADCPLGSLEALAEKTYPDAPREAMRNLKDRIRGLDRRQTLRASARPNSGPPSQRSRMRSVSCDSAAAMRRSLSLASRRSMVDSVR